MAAISGVWELVAQSPMGVQKSDLTLTDGASGSFSGKGAGPMGDVEVIDGKVSGEIVTFTLKVSKPFPMALKAQAQLNGDTMQGEVDTGTFGKMKITATRKA